jgi:hypothetical protein
MNKLSLARRLFSGALQATADHLDEFDGPSAGTILVALFVAGAAGCVALYAVAELKNLQHDVAHLRLAIDKLGERVGPARGSSSSSVAQA